MASTGKRTSANGKEQRELSRARRALKAAETTFNADTLDSTAAVQNLTGEDVVLWSEDGTKVLRTFPADYEAVATIYHSGGFDEIIHGLPVLSHSVACAEGMPSRIVPGKHTIFIVPPEVGAAIAARGVPDATYIGPDTDRGLVRYYIDGGVGVNRFILYRKESSASLGHPSGGDPKRGNPADPHKHN